MITLLGWLWWLVLPVRRSLATAQLRRCFPTLDPGVLRRTVGTVAYGYLLLLLGRYSTLRGTEHLRGGTLALAGHFACWDLALVSGARHVPATIFVKTPSNPVAAWLVGRLRARADLELLPPKGSMAAAEAALDRGRLVIFVQDQRHNAGVPAPFFGRPALTSAAFAALLHKRRPPVVGIYQTLDERGGAVMIEPLQIEIPEDRAVAIPAITAATQAFYEDRIRRRPEAWWWLHARWKNAG